MGVSLYPVLEREVPGYDVTAVAGKALAHAVYQWPISALATLGDFFSVSPEEVAELAGYSLTVEEDDEEEEGMRLPPAPPDFHPPAEEWFEPSVGLNAVRSALKAVREAPADATEGQNKWPDERAWVIRDLEAVEAVLVLARRHETRFHFAMDI